MVVDESIRTRTLMHGIRSGQIQTWAGSLGPGPGPGLHVASSATAERLVEDLVVGRGGVAGGGSGRGLRNDNDSLHYSTPQIARHHTNYYWPPTCGRRIAPLADYKIRSVLKFRKIFIHRVNGQGAAIGRVRPSVCVHCCF